MAQQIIHTSSQLVEKIANCMAEMHAATEPEQVNMHTKLDAIIVKLDELNRFLEKAISAETLPPLREDRSRPRL